MTRLPPKPNDYSEKLTESQAEMNVFMSLYSWNFPFWTILKNTTGKEKSIRKYKFCTSQIESDIELCICVFLFMAERAKSSPVDSDTLKGSRSTD